MEDVGNHVWRGLRFPPPPDASAAAAELAQMRDLLAQKDPAAADKITFWDAGSPGYRWIDLVNNRLLENQQIPNVHRVYTYLTMAMYDATIAAWDAKILQSAAPERGGCDTGDCAVAAAESLLSIRACRSRRSCRDRSFLFLSRRDIVVQGNGRRSGTVACPCRCPVAEQISRGLELGRRVAEQVIARAKADGSDAAWTGTVPTGPCMWVGNKPANITMPNWKPIVLAAPDEFRPPAPPDCQSPAVKAEMDAIRQFERKFPNSYKAFFWQSPSGLFTDWYDYASKWMFEDKTDTNPPRAARAYAMLATVHYDAFIASNDGKYAYWYLRPNMLDASITPLFAVPAHPSYPSNHSALSTARCEVLAYLFPGHAEFIRAVGKEAGDSASGQASTMKWTTGPAPRSVKRSRGNLSSGQKPTGRTSGRKEALF